MCKIVEQPSFALNEVLVLLLFLCGAVYANYCMVVFFIIMTLFTMISYFMEFGRLAQVHIAKGRSPFVAMEKGKIFFYVILMVTFLFDFFAIMFTFWAYKVFKYEAFKSSGANAGMPNNNRVDEESGNGNNNGRPSSFTGRGIRIGE